MKTKHKLTVLLAFASSIGFSQIIEYTHSNSGNRTQRKQTFNTFRVGNKDSAQSVKEFPRILMSEGMSVYPNPAKDRIVVSINDYDASETNSMSLLDAKGNEVLSQRITQNNSEMDVSQLKSGIYYFKVIKNKNLLYYKLVKVD